VSDEFLDTSNIECFGVIQNKYTDGKEYLFVTDRIYFTKKPGSTSDGYYLLPTNCDKIADDFRDEIFYIWKDIISKWKLYTQEVVK
jgi:hypothetical protein